MKFRIIHLNFNPILVGNSSIQEIEENILFENIRNKRKSNYL